MENSSNLEVLIGILLFTVAVSDSKSITNLTKTIGSTASLPCNHDETTSVVLFRWTVNSSVNKSIVLFVDDGLITGITQRFDISDNGSLSIFNLTERDSGRYTCQVYRNPPRSDPLSFVDLRVVVVTCPLGDLPPDIVDEGGECMNGSELDVGHICNFRCEEGYTLQGMENVSCKENGKLDYQLPLCILGPEGENNGFTYVILIVIPILIVVGLIALFIVCWIKKKRKDKTETKKTRRKGTSDKKEVYELVETESSRLAGPSGVQRELVNNFPYALISQLKRLGENSVKVKMSMLNNIWSYKEMIIQNIGGVQGVNYAHPNSKSRHQTFAWYINLLLSQLPDLVRKSVEKELLTAPLTRPKSIDVPNMLNEHDFPYLLAEQLVKLDEKRKRVSKLSILQLLYRYEGDICRRIDSKEMPRNEINTFSIDEIFAWYVHLLLLCIPEPEREITKRKVLGVPWVLESDAVEINPSADVDMTEVKNEGNISIINTTFVTLVSMERMARNKKTTGLLSARVFLLFKKFEDGSITASDEDLKKFVDSSEYHENPYFDSDTSQKSVSEERNRGASYFRDECSHTLKSCTTVNDTLFLQRAILYVIIFGGKVH